MKTLVKIDKNGTKYWHDDTCPKCNGRGYLYGYEHVAGGVCFKCNGSGKHGHNWVERTPEYEEKLRQRRLAKARKEAPEKNAKFLKAFGYAEDGRTWVVMGNTFEIKDELRAAGAKFDHMLGWHFDHEEAGYDLEVLSVYDMCEITEIGRIELDPEKQREAMNKILAKRNAGNPSQHVGKVGDKLSVVVTCACARTYENSYGRGYRTSYVTLYTFTDDAKNVYMWKSSSNHDLQKGDRLTISGTIKEHAEYKGIKQTVLTRCKTTAC